MPMNRHSFKQVYSDARPSCPGVERWCKPSSVRLFLTLLSHVSPLSVHWDISGRSRVPLPDSWSALTVVCVYVCGGLSCALSSFITEGRFACAVPALLPPASVLVELMGSRCALTERLRGSQIVLGCIGGAGALLCWTHTPYPNTERQRDVPSVMHNGYAQ